MKLWDNNFIIKQTWWDFDWKNRSEIKANRKNRRFLVPLHVNKIALKYAQNQYFDWNNCKQTKKKSTNLIYALQLIRWKKQNCKWIDVSCSTLICMNKLSDIFPIPILIGWQRTSFFSIKKRFQPYTVSNRTWFLHRRDFPGRVKHPPNDGYCMTHHYHHIPVRFFSELIN